MWFDFSLLCRLIRPSLHQLIALDVQCTNKIIKKCVLTVLRYSSNADNTLWLYVTCCCMRLQFAWLLNSIHVNKCQSNCLPCPVVVQSRTIGQLITGPNTGRALHCRALPDATYRTWLTSLMSYTLRLPKQHVHVHEFIKSHNVGQCPTWWSPCWT